MIGLHKLHSGVSQAIMRASGHSWYQGFVCPESSASSLPWLDIWWGGNYLPSLQTGSDSQPVLPVIKLMEPILCSDAPHCQNPSLLCSGGSQAHRVACWGSLSTSGKEQGSCCREELPAFPCYYHKSTDNRISHLSSLKLLNG